MIPIDALRKRAEALHLHGLLAHWSELSECAWVEPLLSWEDTERARRSLERRLAEAHIGRLKPLADFDWDWPQQCDRTAISELMSLEFLKSASNAILVGASGLGKSTIARNTLALTRIDPFLLTKADPQRGLGERSVWAWWSVRRKGKCSGC